MTNRRKIEINRFPVLVDSGYTLPPTRSQGLRPALSVSHREANAQERCKDNLVPNRDFALGGMRRRKESAECLLAALCNGPLSDKTDLFIALSLWEFVSKDRFICKNSISDAHKFCFFCSLSFTHYFFPVGIVEANWGERGDACGVWWNELCGNGQS